MLDEKCEGEFYSLPPRDHVARYEWALRQLQLTIPTGIVLDIGCGSGYGLSIFEKAGFAAVGIDRNPAAIDWCRSRGCEARLANYPPSIIGYCDAITMFEVIEHNPDGMDILRQAMQDAPLVFASVPFDEPPGSNPFHVLSRLTEASFAWMDPEPVFVRLAEAPHSLMIQWSKS